MKSGVCLKVGSLPGKETQLAQISKDQEPEQLGSPHTGACILPTVPRPGGSLALARKVGLPWPPDRSWCQPGRSLQGHWPQVRQRTYRLLFRWMTDTSAHGGPLLWSCLILGC